MKKKILYFIMIFAAIAAVFGLVSCGKKDNETSESSTDIVAEIPYVSDFTCDYYAGKGFNDHAERSTAFGSEDEVLIKLSFTLSSDAFKDGKRRLTIKPILSEGFYGNIVSANTSSVNDEELTAAYDVDDKKSKNCVIEFKTKFNYSNGELQIGYAYDDDEYQTTGSYALSCWQSFKFTYDKETGGYKVSGSSNKEWLSGAEQVKIPDTFDGIPITAIGGYAFSSCKKLINIVIPDTVINIGSGAFLNCGRLSSITIPYGVTNIGSSTFSGCSNLTSITIPNSVTSIEKEAFSECRNLTSITIPDSVTTIGSDVFSGCNNLKYNEYGNVKYLGDEQNPYLALIKPINNDITSVEINGATKVVCNGAFSGCSGMTSVTIPDSITSIGESTFSGCGSLTNITIPDSVTSIGDYAFV